MTDVTVRPQQAQNEPGEYAYQAGFGNEFASEAVAGALPAGRNSPQRAPLGLFAEQLSGTAFTQPRGVRAGKPRQPGQGPAHPAVPVRDRPVAIERQPFIRHRQPP